MWSSWGRLLAFRARLTVVSDVLEDSRPVEMLQNPTGCFVLSKSQGNVMC